MQDDATNEIKENKDDKKIQEIFSIIMITLVVIAICILAILADKDTFTRKVNNNDIIIEQNVLATVGNLKDTYTITAKKNIINLTIIFEYYDSNVKLVSTKTKEIGNIAKGSKFNITIEHTKQEVLTIENYTYSLEGQVKII